MVSSPPPRRPNRNEGSGNRQRSRENVGPPQPPRPRKPAAIKPGSPTDRETESDRDTKVVASEVTQALRIRKAKASTQSEDADSAPDTPIEKVAYGLYVLIGLFGWCAMANAYHSETVGRPTVVETSSDFISSVTMGVSMFWTFVTSSVVYLASIPSVLKFTFTEKLVIPFAMVLAVGGVFAFVRFTDKVSAELEQGFEHSHHRRTGKSSGPKRRR